MPHAIHNIHTPAVEIDEAGTMTRDGYTRIPLPEPLFVGTKEEVEEWRAKRLTA